MKHTFNDNQLKDMTVPTVELRHHQAQLRRALVSRATKKSEKLSISQGVISFMKKRTFITSAGLSAVAIAVFSFATISGPQTVSALELAQKSSKALTQLDAQDSDYKKFSPYFAEWLEQAQKAKDLRVLTYDQLVKLYPEAGQTSPTSGEFLRVIDNPNDGRKPDVRTLKYLAFGVTNEDTKSTIIVGINDKNIPEAALTHFDQMGKPRVGA